MSYENLQRYSVQKTVRFKMTATVLLTFLVMLSGCASIPPQLPKIHQKELDIIESLQASHIVMVDSYVDQKLQKNCAY